MSMSAHEHRPSRIVETNHEAALPEWRMSGDPLIACVIMGETPKAIRIAREHDTAGGEVWLPRSQIHGNGGPCVGRYSVRRGGLSRFPTLIEVPKWLYAKIRSEL